MEITNESKDIISSYYYKIVAATTDYDNISKSDMLNEIIKIYHNSQNIIDIMNRKRTRYFKSNK